jgi:hypothetical protein
MTSAGLYSEVASSLDPKSLTSLARRQHEFEPAPSLEKCVAEAVYETVRLSVLSNAPSRLHCLWAAKDAAAAIDFALKHYPITFGENGMGQGAVPVSTADGRWVVLDMNLFRLAAIGEDVTANEEALSKLEVTARSYWSGEESEAPFHEVLCDKLWVWTTFLTPAGSPPPFAEFMKKRTGGVHES